VRPNEVVLNPDSFRQRRSPRFVIESSHHVRALLLGSVEPLDAVVRLGRSDARDSLVRIEPATANQLRVVEVAFRPSSFLMASGYAFIPSARTSIGRSGVTASALWIETRVFARLWLPLTCMASRNLVS
jgi:hypothetical protein